MTQFGWAAYHTVALHPTSAQFQAGQANPWDAQHLAAQQTMPVGAPTLAESQVARDAQLCLQLGNGAICLLIIRGPVLLPLIAVIISHTLAPCTERHKHPDC